MSDLTRHNGSSKRPDATTSDTNVKLKVTPDTEAHNDTATTDDTTEPRAGNGDATTSGATKPNTDNSNATTGDATIPDTTNENATTESCTATHEAAGMAGSDELAKALIGKLLVGTYLVKEEIQRTSTRRVFRGTDIRTDSQVAIVILPAPHSAKDKRGSTQNAKQSGAKQLNPKQSTAKQSHNDRNESALLKLERDTGINIRAYECEDQFSYCIIALESLDEFENPQPRPPQHPEAVTRREGVPPSLAVAATIVAVSAFAFGNLDGLKSLYQQQTKGQPVNVSNGPVPEAVYVPLTNDSDLNPTNDFIAFDHFFVDGFSPTGNIDMTGINRVVAQSVIVSLNARDINTPTAVFHAQCVASAAKNVARSLRLSLMQASAAGFTLPEDDPNGVFRPGRYNASCFVGEAQSTNVYFPTSLTSAMSVSYPSSLKSQSPGGKRRNGDAYMAGYSKIQVPIGDTTIDIAGVPVFPLRNNELLTIDDIKESKDADPIDSDYLPPNSILVGNSARPSKYSELVACTVFGAADKDYPACIPRGYIRIINGPPPPNTTADCPVNESKSDSFADDWEPKFGFPWVDWSKTPGYRNNKTNRPWYIDPRIMSENSHDKVRTSEGLVGSPLTVLDQIGENNSVGEELILQRITARMKQVDPNLTLADVKKALAQGNLSYAGEPLFLYSPCPGAKLQCDSGFPYMSKTVPNDGNNSAVEVSCDRQYSFKVKDEEQKMVTVIGTQRAVFTPATGWRNLLGDITFEYESEARDSAFTQP